MIDQINKDGFKILKNGKIEVDCLLYTSHATEPDPGVEYKATLSLNEDGSGMKLENHPIISFTFSILISAIAAICSNGNFASCILVTTLTNFCFSPFS